MKKWTKKSIALLLSVILIVCAIPFAASSVFAETEGIFKYEVANGNATITGLVDNKYSGDLKIPSTVGGYPVISIGDRAFSIYVKLKSITIPDSVTSIGQGAFEYCLNLTSVTIGNSVTSISNGAFYGCSVLSSLTIPDSVTSIGEEAFCGCSGLKSVTIPDSVITIGENAFYSCLALTSVKIGNSVTAIGYRAFKDCRMLKSVKIGNSVTTIGGSAFSNCSALESVKIGNSVISIGDGAFSECRKLTSVTIPSGVKRVGDSAFNYCVGLTSITIPDSVTFIGGKAFEGCTGLKDVYFTGTKEQKSAMCICYYNTYLLGAAWHNNYKKTFSITYDLSGGKNNPDNPKKYTSGMSDIVLKSPTRKGYVFKNWYNGSEKITAIKKDSAGDITLTAKWTAITYNITYKLAGGKKVKNPATYTVTSSTIKLKNPTKKGYKFVGWYKGSKRVTQIKKGSTGNITLTAKWKKK